MNDVEIQTRARKEEERIWMEAHCKEHGQTEIQQIQKAIEERHAKELQVKQQLESAQPAYDMFRAAMMKKREE